MRLVLYKYFTESAFGIAFTALLDLYSKIRFRPSLLVTSTAGEVHFKSRTIEPTPVIQRSFPAQTLNTLINAHGKGNEDKWTSI